MIQSKQKMLQVLGELNPSQTCRYATVDENRLPVDERGCITGQEYCSADQFIDIAPAPCRGTFSRFCRIQRCGSIIYLRVTSASQWKP